MQYAFEIRGIRKDFGGGSYIGVTGGKHKKSQSGKVFVKLSSLGLCLMANF